jgi:hypothetical protein
MGTKVYNNDIPNKMLAWTMEKMEKGEMPFPELFAETIGVGHKTLFNWCSEHSDFKEMYDRCKALREVTLMDNGLKGKYNAIMAKFGLINKHNYKEKNDDEAMIMIQGIIRVALELIPERTEQRDVMGNLITTDKRRDFMERVTRILKSNPEEIEQAEFKMIEELREV